MLEVLIKVNCSRTWEIPCGGYKSKHTDPVGKKEFKNRVSRPGNKIGGISVGVRRPAEDGYIWPQLEKAGGSRRISPVSLSHITRGAVSQCRKFG